MLVRSSSQQSVDHILEYVGPAFAESPPEQPNWNTFGDARVASLISGLTEIAATSFMPTATGPPKSYKPAAVSRSAASSSSAAGRAGNIVPERRHAGAKLSAAKQEETFDELMDFVEKAAAVEVVLKNSAHRYVFISD